MIATPLLAYNAEHINIHRVKWCTPDLNNFLPFITTRLYILLQIHNQRFILANCMATHSFTVLSHFPICKHSIIMTCYSLDSQLMWERNAITHSIYTLLYIISFAEQKEPHSYSFNSKDNFMKSAKPWREIMTYMVINHPIIIFNHGCFIAKTQ